jgi:desampylase
MIYMWAMSLRISSQHFEDLLRQSEMAAPNECCGLLFGSNQIVGEIIPAENVSIMPQLHFEIDPQRLIAAERFSRTHRQGLIGYYHSHPNGNCQPSCTDANLAAIDGRYWLIIAGNQITAWRTVQNGLLYGVFDPVELDTSG